MVAAAAEERAQGVTRWLLFQSAGCGAAGGIPADALRSYNLDAARQWILDTNVGGFMMFLLLLHFVVALGDFGANRSGVNSDARDQAMALAAAGLVLCCAGGLVSWRERGRVAAAFASSHGAALQSVRTELQAATASIDDGLASQVRWDSGFCNDL